MRSKGTQVGLSKYRLGELTCPPLLVLALDNIDKIFLFANKKTSAFYHFSTRKSFARVKGFAIYPYCQSINKKKSFP